MVVQTFRKSKKKKKGLSFNIQIEKFQLDKLCASRHSHKALPG
jgi:hypothetical protein